MVASIYIFAYSINTHICQVDKETMIIMILIRNKIPPIDNIKFTISPIIYLSLSEVDCKELHIWD